MSAPSATTVVIGLGNDVLTDDGVGPAVARELERRLPRRLADVKESANGGLRLVELLAGYARAVIVDAITWGKGPPGTIYELSLDQAIPTARAVGFHDASLKDALGFGRALAMPLPHTIAFFAIEAQDAETFGEALTPGVAAAVPEVARRIEALLRQWRAREGEAPCTKPALRSA